MSMLDEANKMDSTASYMNYPLRISPRLRSYFQIDLTGSVQFVAVGFRRINYNHFDCMACAECGNEWIGVDWQDHGRAHQMGLDYALYIQAKLQA